VTIELAETTRRERAIERRWIPEHEAALHRLELALDEREREEVARARWAAGRSYRPGMPSEPRSGI
jgi:vacuolar-type H+-ATPase subunit D/Vma8